MAKQKTKKASAQSKKKQVVTKKASAKKSNIVNKKRKSATPKKSVSKKSPEKPQKVAVSTPSENTTAKPEVSNDNPIKLTEVNLGQETKKNEVNYNEATFVVAAPEVGFLKLEDTSFAVKLTAGVNIKRKDDLNFEFSGKQADGTPFGTIFDCVDVNEAELFMKELIEYSKTGELVIQGLDSPKDNQSSNTETVYEHGQNQVSEVKPKDLSEYKDVPLKVEDMNTIIDQMKMNEQNNQNNAVNQVNQNPVVQNPVVQNPINNFMPNNGINVQPPISNTHTPDPNFNPTIPSQNPQLYPDNNYNLHNNTGGSVVTMITDEQILNDMRKYAKSIEDTLNETFQVRIQGGLPQSDFMNMVNGCSKEYTYDLKNDGKGYFLNVNKGKYQIRVPENPTEYLKIY